MKNPTTCKWSMFPYQHRDMILAEKVPHTPFLQCSLLINAKRVNPKVKADFFLHHVRLYSAVLLD